MPNDTDPFKDNSAASSLVLTEDLLRSILWSAGITPRNAVVLSRRVCAALPDLPTLVKRTEKTVVEQLMAEIQSNMTDEVLKRLHEAAPRRNDRVFGSIDEDLCERIDARARELIREHHGSDARPSRRFELSLLRANHPDADGELHPVLVLTSEQKLDGQRDA